jgi:hypothetical protein
MANKRKPKFRVGQVVALAHSKRNLTFRILEVVEHEGEFYYKWNRNNAAAEHMLRPLTKREFEPRSPSASKEE